jgi:hypothetical protein
MTKKIGIAGSIKLIGNVNRIIEMSDAGMGDNAISGHFKDQKVDISPEFVRAIRTEVSEATKKGVSKKSVNTVIQAATDNANTKGDNSLQPA